MLELHHKRMINLDKSLALVKEVYKTAAKFPGNEKLGLISQPRRLLFR